MIRKDPANFFECVYPTLEPGEKEILFHHPTESLSCNQLGVIYCDEEVYFLVDLPNKTCFFKKKISPKIFVSVGTKSNIVWECYHQTEAKNRILQLNNNELDYTLPNLFSIEGETQYQRVLRYQKKKAWELESAKVLVAKETQMATRGLDKATYRSFLNLPNWLTKGADSLV